jgi:hypothetical protein
VQLGDRQPRRDGGDERPGRGDLFARVQRLVHAQQGLLHDVLCLGDAAQHPVGDRERERPQIVEQSVVIGHRLHHDIRVSQTGGLSGHT